MYRFIWFRDCNLVETNTGTYFAAMCLGEKILPGRLLLYPSLVMLIEHVFLLQSKTTAAETGNDEKTFGHHQPSLGPILEEEEEEECQGPLHHPLHGDFFVQEAGSSSYDANLPPPLGQGRRRTSSTPQPHAAVVEMLSFEPSAAEVEEEEAMMETMKMGLGVEEVERGENKELIVPGKRPEQSWMRDTSSSLVTDQAAVALSWFRA